MFAKFLTYILAIGLSFTTLLAEEYGTIKGKITDEKGEGLIGASVEVMGTGMGAMTDIYGDYKIVNLLPGKYKVKIRMILYEDQIFEVEIKENICHILDCTLIEVNIPDIFFDPVYLYTYPLDF